MGAFYLFRHPENICRERMERTFSRKGFSSCKEFNLGKWTLLLWTKQAVLVKNWLVDNVGDSVYVVGTPVYHGLSYYDGLRALLVDAKTDRIQFEELQGSFVLIFYYGGGLHVLNDELNVGPIFIDEKLLHISSSFLAILSAAHEKRSINTLALREKLLTGYVVAPDTLAAGIIKANNDIQDRIHWDNFSFIKHPTRPTEISFSRCGFNAAVDDQISNMRHKIRALSNYSRQYLPELGLSSGYDSRLLLCLCDQLPAKVGVHTHATAGVHDKESRISSELCRLNGNELRVIPTRPMHEQSVDEFATILDEGLYYYDGRNSAEMGAFSETYTRTYRMNVTHGFGLGLSGLGGEIYRNYFISSLPRLPLQSWMKKHVYYLGTISRFSEIIETHNYIVNKMNKILGLELSDWIDQFTLRRYYGEIRMPESNGIVTNANNQLTFYTTPFGEYRTILKAYEATPYIGFSGAFEAAMITRCNRRLAEVNSNYGYSFSHIPFGMHIRAAMKGMIPDIIWVSYDNFRLNRGWRQYLPDLYALLCTRHTVMREIDQIIRSIAPYIDLNLALRDARFLGNMVYVGYFLREFSPFLKLIHNCRSDD